MIKNIFLFFALIILTSNVFGQWYWDIVNGKDAAKNLTRQIANDTDPKTIEFGTINPSVVATNASQGSVFISTSAIYQKLDNGLSTNWQPLLIGPAGSGTDECVARWDGTGVPLLQNSLLCITDLGVASGLTQFNLENLRLDGNTISSTDVNGDISLTPNGTGSVIISGVTATRPLKVDASNQIISGQINLASSDDVTGLLPLANAGLGVDASAFADFTLLYKNGAAYSSIGPLTNGQLIIGSTGVAPVASTLTGTANQISVSNSAGSITLSTPQDIGTASNVTFGSVTDSSLTDGRNTFAGASGNLSDDADWLFNTTGNVVTLTNGQMNVDNLRLDGNTLSSEDANGNIVLNPNGTGQINLPDLTASTPLKLDASNNVISSDISLTTDVTGVLPEANGGTNQSTYATGDILYASAANTLSKLPAGTNGEFLSLVAGIPSWEPIPGVTGTANTVAVFNGAGALSSQALTNGQVLIGSTGAAPVAATITGTANQISVTNGAGSITLSTPQDIGTASNVTFGSVTDSSLTAGRNVFAGTSGDLSDDADWLFNTTGNVVTLTNGQMNVDNLRLDLNTLSATDTNGSVTVQSDGTGDTYYKKGSDDSKRIGSRNPELFNLINYPSFEENITEGTCTTATCTQESTEVINGTKSLKMAFSASTGNYLVDKSTSSQYSGTSYNLSCWIKADSTATGVQFVPRVNGSDVTGYLESVIADGAWRKYDIRIGSGSTSIGYKVNASASITGNVYVDNCSLGLGSITQGIVSDVQTFEGYWGSAANCDIALGTTTDGSFVNLTTDADCNTATEYLDQLGCTMSTSGDFKITCDNLEPATYETCWEFNHNFDMAGTTGGMHFRTAYCNGSSLCATSGDNYSAVMQVSYNQPVYREKMICSNATVTKSGQLTINLQKQVVSTGGGISVNQLKNINSPNRVRLLINKKKDISTVIANSQGPSQIKFYNDTGCSDTTTSATFEDMTDSDCDYATATKIGSTTTPTTTGAFALKIPSVKAGRYQVSFGGLMAANNLATCSFRLYDGTNVVGPLYVDAVTGSFISNDGHVNIVEYTSTQTNLEWKLQGKRVSGSGDCFVYANTDDRALAITMVPISETVSGIESSISYIKLNTGNNWGSTNTAIRRFSSTTESFGSDITYSDSSTNGATFTINTSGLYSITYSDYNISGSFYFFGISRNSNQLTTAPESITNTHRLAIDKATGLGTAYRELGTVTAIEYLQAGDIIRAHTSGSGLSTGGTSTLASFYIAKIK